MNLIVFVKLEFKILKRNSKRPKLPNRSKSPSTFPDHSKNIEPKTREAQAKSKKKKFTKQKMEFEKKKNSIFQKRGLVKNPFISSIYESLFPSHSLISFFSQIQNHCHRALSENDNNSVFGQVDDLLQLRLALLFRPAPWLLQKNIRLVPHKQSSGSSLCLLFESNCVRFRLMSCKKNLVFFRSKEHKRKALKLLDLGNAHSLFDENPRKHARIWIIFFVLYIYF